MNLLGKIYVLMASMSLHFLASVASPSLVEPESSPGAEESDDSAEEEEAEEAWPSCSLIWKEGGNRSQCACLKSLG